MSCIKKRYIHCSFTTKISPAMPAQWHAPFIPLNQNLNTEYSVKLFGAKSDPNSYTALPSKNKRSRRKHDDGLQMQIFRLSEILNVTLGAENIPETNFMWA